MSSHTSQEQAMNAITRLSAVAIAACGIAGGVAVAQQNTGTEATMNPATANYGTPPGAPLKRDGSLSASGVATGTVTDNSAASTTTTTTTSTSTDTSSAPAPAAVDNSAADNSSASAEPAPAPRTDRN
jgi:hypothetical protein